MTQDKTNLVKTVLELNIARAAGTFGFAQDTTFLRALEESGVLLRKINCSIQKNQVFRKREFQSVFQFSAYRNFLYWLIRTKKPQVVVETGVFHGLTSAWILQALADNGSGKLISVDLPRRDWQKYFPEQTFGPGAEGEDELPNNELPGWIIPDDLRSRWTLNLGPSSLHLERILGDEAVDLFIHDSDHSYEVMRFECETAMRAHPEALIVIDDFDLNTYLFEALQQHELNCCFMDDVTDKLQLSQCFALCQLKKS